MKVPAIQYVITALVIVLPLAFGGRLIYRWFRPGQRKRPSGVLTAVVAFLLTWVVGLGGPEGRQKTLWAGTDLHGQSLRLSC